MKALKYDKDINIIWKDKKRYFGLPISFTRYAVAEKPGSWAKLLCETGLLSTHIEEIHLYRVDDISVFQGLFAKLFGVGTIVIHCDDSSCQEIFLKNIKDPYKIRALINDKIEAARKEKRVVYGEMQ